MIKKDNIVCIDILYNPDDQVISNVKKYHNLVNRTILVDNSEKDNSNMFTGMDKVKYIPLKSNTGIAHATNIGIKQTNEPYILTMDQDSTISKELIDSYISFLEMNDSDEIGALTPQYDTDRNHVGKVKGWENVLLSMQSGTLIKRSTFDNIGLFKEELFLDVVDWEFFLRMNQANLKLIKVNSAILKHQPAITQSISFGPLELKYGVASPIRYYYQARNLLWTAKKYKNPKLYLILVVKLFKIMILFDNKKKYLRAFNKGIRDAKHNKLGKCANML